MGAHICSSSEVPFRDVASTLSNSLRSYGSPYIRITGSTREVFFSARHDGLAIQLGRFLRPIWSQQIIVPPSPIRPATLAISPNTLTKVQNDLQGFRQFFDSQRDQGYQFGGIDGSDRLAWEQEELSMNGLQLLMKQATEAISFVLLLVDYKLGDVVAG